MGKIGEGAFSRLQDELYKTVTALRQTKDTALAARNNFAENLYNIAHQLKTPITAISLSVQMLRSEMTGEGTEAGHLARIAGQLARLTRLEEALLLLSRIDAGTLTLEKKEVDVFHPACAVCRKSAGAFSGEKYHGGDTGSGRDMHSGGYGVDHGGRDESFEKLHGAHPVRRYGSLRL